MPLSRSARTPSASTKPARLLGYVLLLDLLKEDRTSWRQFLLEEATPQRLASNAAFLQWLRAVAEEHPEVVQQARGVVRNFRASLLDLGPTPATDA